MTLSVKKILRFIFAMCVASGVACACSEISDCVPARSGSCITVSIDDCTKMAFGELSNGRRPVLWTNGDRICAGGVSSRALENLEAPSAVATFYFDEPIGESKDLLYPASLYADADTVVLPGHVSSGVIPVGGRGLTLKALTAVLKLNILKGGVDATLKRIYVTSKGGAQLCGPFVIDYAGACLAGADTSAAFRRIGLAVDDTLGGDTLSYYLPLPEGTYGLKVRVVDSEGRYMEKETTADKAFAKGCIVNMHAFGFEPTATQTDIIENDVVKYSVVCPSSSSSAARLVATKICTELSSLSGSKVPIKTESEEESAREIIVGSGLYAPAKDLYARASYGKYLFSKQGNKILVSAIDIESYGALRDDISKLFSENYSDGFLSLDDSDFRSRTVLDVSGYIPPYQTAKMPAYVLQCGANSDKDIAMQVGFNSCSDTDFEAYCAGLEGEGYAKACDNAFGTCRYATYTDSHWQIGVSLYKDTGLMRIVSEPIYPKPIWTIEGTPGSVKTLMMQVCQDNVKITAGSHPGGYIVRLSDGRYFIYDTGTDPSADQMIEYMRSRNTFTDGKIHIALIIISHPHADHRSGLNVFASKYASEIVCEGVAFNMTNHKRQSHYTTETLHGYLNTMISSATKLGAPCYCLRAGQVVNLAGARLEVLFTPDELGTYFLSGKNAAGDSDTAYDQNNSSNIVRLTVGGQKITFTGDCRGGEAGIFNSTVVNSFSSDIMTVAHHGFNVTTTLQMYKKAKPFVLFWTIRRDEVDTSRSFVTQLMAATYVKKHFFEEELVEIDLPYSLE